jgi:hypothetical protein
LIAIGDLRGALERAKEREPMVCNQCNTNEARVHLTQKTAAGHTTTRHFCEACAEQSGCSDSSGQRLLLFPWEEQGGGSSSVAGVVAKAEGEIVVLRVVRSSHYAPGAELRIRAKYVPELMRRVGCDVSFNLPAEHLPLVLESPAPE